MSIRVIQALARHALNGAVDESDRTILRAWADSPEGQEPTLEAQGIDATAHYAQPPGVRAVTDQVGRGVPGRPITEDPQGRLDL